MWDYWGRLASWRFPGVPRAHLHWSHKYEPPCLAFYVGSGDQTQVLMLAGLCLLSLPLPPPPPAPCFYFEGVLVRCAVPCSEAQLPLSLGHRGNPSFVCWLLGHWCISPGLHCFSLCDVLSCTPECYGPPYGLRRIRAEAVVRTTHCCYSQRQQGEGRHWCILC